MTDDIRTELASLLDAWSDAIAANDNEAFARFAADDWVIVGGTGPETRQRYLDAVASGALTHDRFRSDVVQARRYGDVAVAIAHVQNAGTYQGAPFSVDEWSTTVFVRTGSGWQGVLTALTPRTAEA